MIRLNFQNIMLFASTVFAAACSNAPKADKNAEVVMEKTKIPGFDTAFGFVASVSYRQVLGTEVGLQLL